VKTEILHAEYSSVA